MEQVLSVEQVQHLQELGLELKPSLIHYFQIINVCDGKWYLSPTKGDIISESPTYRYIPAYTLQDVLGLLPTEIKSAVRRFWLRIDLSDECLYYYYEDCNLVEHREKVFGYDGIDGLIDAAYEMLCWCIEQGYINK